MPTGKQYIGVIGRDPQEKFGENLSILDFGAKPDGSVGVSAAWNKAMTAAQSLETLTLNIPFGNYAIDENLVVPANVGHLIIRGQGASSLFTRAVNLPDNTGCFEIFSSKVTFENLAVDGAVLIPVGYAYGVVTDPMDVLLTKNTSFWVRGGTREVIFRSVKITHTGGYAITFDGRDADVTDCLVDACLLENNRPHLFGPAGDLNYGSWTGGIHYQGDCRASTGKLFAVRRLKVINSTFRRGTGNQIWGHLYGFDTLHSDIVTDNNYFSDIGRDGILVGGVTGGSASHNKFRRIGYVATDDTSAAVPRWTAGQWGVGLDTAGLVRNVPYIGNSFMSCYGAAMDLDGYAQGSITGNVAKVPYSGEPEYDEDSIAAWTGNYSYGAQISNSNYIDEAGIEVIIKGNTFINMGLGAIRMYASRRCSASENIIHHPAGATVAPIILGNIGNEDNRRSYDNSVTYNDIHYEPVLPVGVVQEDPNGFLFQSTDVNRVYGNRLYGANIFEFYKDTNSGSTTAQEFASTKSALTGVDKNILVREDGLFRIYWKKGTTTESVITVIDTVTLPGPTFGGPLLNVSLSGVGGVLSTAGRTTSAFDDAVLSGKGYFDSLVCIASSTYNSVDADIFPDTVALFRRNNSTGNIEYSTTVSSGTRVWTVLSSTGLSGLTAGRVPFASSSSVLVDSANFAWNNVLRALTVTGITGTPSLIAATSYIQSQEGFYTTSGSSSAINAPAGGVTALSLISVRNDGVPGLTLSRASSTARNYGLGIDSSGSLFIRDETGSAVRLSISVVGLVTIGSSVLIDQAGNLSASATVAAAGVNVSGTVFNSLQVPLGGLYTGLGVTVDQAVYLKTLAGTPNNPGPGYGGWSHRSGSTYLYWNGSTWATVDLTTVGAGVTSLSGTTNQVNVSAATGAVTLSLPQPIHAGASPLFAGMTVSNNFGSTVGGVAGVVSVVDGSFAASSPRFMVRNTSSTSNGVSIELNGPTARWAIGQDVGQTGANDFYLFDRVADATRFLIDSGGNVAIGANSVTTLTSNSPKLEVVGSTRTTWGHGQNALFILPAANNGASNGDAGLYLWISEPGHTWTGAGIGRNMYNMTNWPRVNSALTSQMIRFGEWADIRFVSEIPGGTRFYPMTLYEDRVLVSTQTDDSSGAKLQVNGFARAITGFATPATATDAIQAPSGGVTARFLIGTRSLTLTADSATNAGLSGSAQGRIYFDSGTNKFRISENGGAYVDLLAAAGVTSLSGTANQVNVSASTGAVTLSLPQSIHTGATPTFVGVVATVFNSTANGTTIAFQTNNSNFQVNGDGVVSSAGGINVSGINVIDPARAILGTQLQVDSTSPDSQVYVSSAAPRIGLGNHATYASRTQGARFVMATTPGHFTLPASGDTFIFTEGVGTGNAGNLYLGANIQLTLKLDDSNDATFARRIILSGLLGAAGLTVLNGWVDAAAGFFTAVGSYEALKATSGGVSVRSVHASVYSQVGQNSGTPTATLGSVLQAGTLYWDTGLSSLRLFNGSTWVSVETGGGITSINSLTSPAINIAAGTAISVTSLGSTITVANTGVTLLTGTSNQISVSGSTGSITLSLPQDIHTGASPTFAGVNAGAFSATASGTSIGFQTSNFNFQVDGNGNISGAGSANMTQGFRVNGMTVIDSSRAAINLASVTSSGVIQSQVTGSSIAFQTTNFNFQVNGNGVVSSAGGINVSGSTVINTSRQFVGDGVNVGSNGVSAGGYNLSGGYIGQTWNIGINGGGTFNIGGAGSYTNIQFRGGIIVGAA